MNHTQLLEIGLQKRNKQIDTSWQLLAETHSDGMFATGEAFRCWVKTQLRSKGVNLKTIVENQTLKDISTPPNYKETVEIHKDKSQSSDKLIKMSENDSKTPEKLLEYHGYDVETWELISSRSNIWNAFSKDTGILQLYSSKISVKPIVNKSTFSVENLIESFKQLESVNIKTNKTNIDDKKLLEIPLFDAHFGISDYEYYQPTQQLVFDKLSSRKWEEVLFVVGQDMLHNDDFRGRTSSGTPIESTDMEKAWNDCRKFYEPLIEQAIKQSNSVKIMYAKGNHDESMSWAFVQLLKVRFPQAIFDDSMIERKVHVFGDNFIGVTHGDKARKNLHNIFPIEFPELWAKAKSREIHIGHLHVEDGRDYFGMMVRTLSTRNRTDLWHKNNGYVGGHKRFMLFEYSVQELDSIHYV